MDSLSTVSEDHAIRPDPEFLPLIARARTGDRDAAGELLARYSGHIQRVVRSHLNRRMRTRFDSQDFVQAVCASLLAHQSRLGRFQHPDELIAYLGAMTANKVIDECRRCLTYEKQNVNRERPLEVAREILSPEPTASQVAVARELWDALLEGQPPHYRRIVELRTGGMTFEEIATEVGLSTRQVRRVMRSLADRLGS